MTAVASRVARSTGQRVTNVPAQLLQRRCACGGTPGPDGECAECRAKRLQRRAVATGPAVAPPVVHEVLGSAGSPLEPGVRGEMEARFGHDFSQVRVHTDARAAASARVVDAAAYTVGSSVVFGPDRYAPATTQGRSLLAHELAHVVQQAGSTRPGRDLPVQPADHPAEREAQAGRLAVGGQGQSVQRACLPAAECTSQEGSLTSFVRQTESAPENKARAARRAAACAGATPSPACTADGHGASAPQLTAFLRANDPARLGFITGIYIDKDMPATYGAYTTPCGSFIPPLPGGYCTFVPDYLESEAGVYNGARSNAIGRRDRAEWRTNALEILTHETEHARFLSAPALTTPTCDLSKFQWDLSELAAITTGFAIVYRRSFRKPPEARRADLDRWFDWNVPIRRNSETIGGIVRLIRCQCNCADADSYITRAIGFATAGWNSDELSAFHSELTKPKYALRWPIQPPAAIDVNDLPPTIPTTEPEDLPIASGR